MTTSTPAPTTVPALPNPAAPAHAPAAGFHLPSYLLGLTTALALLGAALFFWPRPQPAAVQLQPPPTPAPTLPAPTLEPTPPPSPLVVFVSGGVAQPGLYTLSPAARIGDAIAAAGGLLPGVDPALINQAQPLLDGAQLHIPAPAATPLQAQAAPVENSLETDMEGGRVEGAELPPALATEPPLVVPEPPAGLSVAAPSAPPTPATAPAIVAPPVRAATASLAGSGGLININTASRAELESLPAIGPSKAQAIIANRPYATVDELDRVPGIGPATLEQIRPYVTTQ